VGCFFVVSFEYEIVFPSDLDFPEILNGPQVHGYCSYTKVSSSWIKNELPSLPFLNLPNEIVIWVGVAAE